MCFFLADVSQTTLAPRSIFIAFKQDNRGALRVADQSS
jgi:hypothetical protein